MSAKSKVSFVLPVYNVGRFLPQCLDSLCHQTLEEIEIICVDDGSQDDSLGILREYQEKDPRIVVLENTISGPGAGEARNLGLSVAQGEYILVVDSDDYFHLSLAERTYEKAVETGADVVLFDVVKFDTHTGEEIPTHQFLSPQLLPKGGESFSPKEVADRLFLLLDGVVWNKLMRRSLVVDHGCKFFPVHVVDDMNFTFSVGVLAEKIAVVPEVLLYYRVGNGSSQMANLHRDPLTPVKVLGRLRGFLQEQGLWTTYEKTYIERGIGLGMFYFDGLAGQDCFFDLYQALQEQAVVDLGWTTSSVALLDSPLKKQWVEDVLSLSPADFLEKQQATTQVLSGKGYGIYGFGVRTSLVYEKIVSSHGVVSALVDSSLEKQGQGFAHLVVASPQTLCPDDLDFVVITTVNYFEEMKETLLELGFSPEQIVFM